MNRFVYEYRSTIPIASGDSLSAKRLSRHAAKTSSAQLTTTNTVTNAGVTNPAGNARIAVRGFPASMLRSAKRLNPMAALRAPTIATTIQPTIRQLGQP